MPRSKTFAVGSAVVAGAFTATMSLAGTAAAGGPATAAYKCLSVSYPSPTLPPIAQDLPNVTAQFTTASGKIKMLVGLPANLTFAADTISATIHLVSTSGVVTYSDGQHKNLPSSPNGLVHVGPVALSGGAATGPLHTLAGTGPPGPTNWTVRLQTPAAATTVWCFALSDFSPALYP